MSMGWIISKLSITYQSSSIKNFHQVSLAIHLRSFSICSMQQLNCLFLCQSSLFSLSVLLQARENYLHALLAIVRVTFILGMARPPQAHGQPRKVVWQRGVWVNVRVCTYSLRTVVLVCYTSINVKPERVGNLGNLGPRLGTLAFPRALTEEWGQVTKSHVLICAPNG